MYESALNFSFVLVLFNMSSFDFCVSLLPISFVASAVNTGLSVPTSSVGVVRTSSVLLSSMFSLALAHPRHMTNTSIIENNIIFLFSFDLFMN